MYTVLVIIYNIILLYSCKTHRSHNDMTSHNTRNSVSYEITPSSFFIFLNIFHTIVNNGGNNLTVVLFFSFFRETIYWEVEFHESYYIIVGILLKLLLP